MEGGSKDRSRFTNEWLNGELMMIKTENNKSRKKRRVSNEEVMKK